MLITGGWGSQLWKGQRRRGTDRCGWVGRQQQKESINVTYIASFHLGNSRGSLIMVIFSYILRHTARHFNMCHYGNFHLLFIVWAVLGT